jgi:hypothetical protein
MKLMFSMLGAAALGLLLLEVGEQTGSHLVSQAGFVSLAIGAIGSFVDLLLSGRRCNRTESRV